MATDQLSLLQDRVRKRMVQAISEYDMLREGDRVLVAVSGGKDSSAMLLLLEEIRRRAPFMFSISPVILDQKQPGFDVSKFKTWLAELGFDLTVLEEDTHAIALEKTPPGKAFCGVCSRLRRGILYTYAATQGFTKIALGHHRDDLNATVLMNMFYSGTLGSMPPKLKSDDGRNIVIRPMAFVPEAEIIELATKMDFPIIPCRLCGTQEDLKRARIGALLRDLEKERADIGFNLLAAQKNLKPSQLADPSHHDFTF